MKKYINPNFYLTEKAIKDYREKGFVKLENFFTEDAIKYFIKRVNHETKAASSAFAGYFSKMSYDILAEDKILFKIFADPIFKKTLTTLNNMSVFYAEGLGFSLLKNTDPGFPWHHDNQSFGYIRPQDFGFTIWVPLTMITPKQGGGMAYVPANILNAKNMYDYIHPAISEFLKGTTFDTANKEEQFDLAELTNGFMGTSPVILKLLDYFAVEDSFNPCDVFIFNKYVFHKSVKLEEGPIESRKAFAMRFIDANALYDKENAEYIDLARKKLGYSVGTTFHMDVCKNSGEKIAESPYFEDPEKRLIKK